MRKYNQFHQRMKSEEMEQIKVNPKFESNGFKIYQYN